MSGQIYGIGCDIVSIDRIQKAWDRQGDALLDRMLTEVEKADLSRLTHHIVRASFLAKRFAAKEALSKALGIGIGRNGLSFTNIEVSNDDLGRPYFSLPLLKDLLISEIGSSNKIAYDKMAGGDTDGNSGDADIATAAAATKSVKSVSSIHLSLSDDAGFAMAYCIVEVA